MTLFPYPEMLRAVHNRNSNLRVGQSFIIWLGKVNPLLMEVITGTDYDCFYDDKLFDRSVEFCSRHWDLIQLNRLDCVPMMIECYDPKVTEAPFEFIQLNELTHISDVVSVNGDEHWKVFHTLCEALNYRFRFYSSIKGGGYKIVVNCPEEMMEGMIGSDVAQLESDREYELAIQDEIDQIKSEE